MVAASRGVPEGAASTSAAPIAHETKKAHWCETPRRRGLTSRGAAGRTGFGAASVTSARVELGGESGDRRLSQLRVERIALRERGGALAQLGPLGVGEVAAEGLPDHP